jgi:chorismate synthase
MEEIIEQTAKMKDSIGGIIEGIVLNMPAGIGNPIFNSLDSDLGRILFSIPGVKGVEIGAGFRSSSLKGSENNDQYSIRNGRVFTLSNNSGGIIGGISTGMPITVRVAFKPTPSIAKTQKTVNLDLMRETSIKINGRHDPCIVPRAVPVVKSCIALIIADQLLKLNIIPQILSKQE